jgi:carbamoyltransferase
VYEHLETEEALLWRATCTLAEGNVVGWFQGRMEFGPRALGNRSILADATRPDMQRRLNEKI